MLEPIGEYTTSELLQIGNRYVRGNGEFEKLNQFAETGSYVRFSEQLSTIGHEQLVNKALAIGVNPEIPLRHFTRMCYMNALSLQIPSKSRPFRLAWLADDVPKTYDIATEIQSLAQLPLDAQSIEDTHDVWTDLLYTNTLPEREDHVRLRRHIEKFRGFCIISDQDSRNNKDAFTDSIQNMRYEGLQFFSQYLAQGNLDEVNRETRTILACHGFILTEERVKQAKQVFAQKVADYYETQAVQNARKARKSAKIAAKARNLASILSEEPDFEGAEIIEVDFGNI